MEKNYNLLRPFDLEAAKRGEKICLSNGNEFNQLIKIVGSTFDGGFIFMDALGSMFGKPVNELRMSPLAWVEGRPVYKGDVLYSTTHKPTGIVVVEDICERDGIIDGSGHYGWPVGTLTWQKPKTKREGWVNLYSNRHGLMPNVQLDNGKPFKSYDNAMQNGIHDDYIGAIKIEWEE